MNLKDQSLLFPSRLIEMESFGMIVCASVPSYEPGTHVNAIYSKVVGYGMLGSGT